MYECEEATAEKVLFSKIERKDIKCKIVKEN